MISNAPILRKKRFPKVSHSVLFKLLLLFVFFLPLRGVQIPVGIFGFEINPARIASTLIIIILFMSLCIDAYYTYNFFRSGRYRNVYVFYFFVYTLFSIVYYYLLVASGKTVFFGATETGFLINWRGRPFAQLMALITYGIIPFYLVRYYAQYERTRRSIERVIVGTLLFLVYFAYVQLITYIIFRVPLIGRQILEYKYDLGIITIFGIPLYRVNSLGGEPRDFASFLVGAIPFYMYANYKQLRNLTKINFTKIHVVLMLFVFFLATSTSAFLSAGISFIIILIDALYHGRVRFRLKYMKYGFVGLVVVVWLFHAQVIRLIGSRTLLVYQGLNDQLATSAIQPINQDHFVDLGVLFYTLNIRNISPIYTVFGYGYSNFLTPLEGILAQYFDYRPEQARGVLNPNSFAIKMFLEEGMIGIMLYLMMFFYTLKMNAQLLHMHRAQGDVQGYNKALLLRIAFIGFFIAGAIQISYYYFIIMGLIAGWLNEVARHEQHGLIAGSSGFQYGKNR